MTPFHQIIAERWWLIPTISGIIITLYWLFVKEPKGDQE